jgi:hypothetical protein
LAAGERPESCDRVTRAPLALRTPLSFSLCISAASSAAFRLCSAACLFASIRANTAGGKQLADDVGGRVATFVEASQTVGTAAIVCASLSGTSIPSPPVSMSMAKTMFDVATMGNVRGSAPLRTGEFTNLLPVAAGSNLALPSLLIAQKSLPKQSEKRSTKKERPAQAQRAYWMHV